MPTAADPHEIARRLEAFRESAQRFSDEKSNLIEKYPERWVAVYDGKVVADAANLDKLIRKLEKDGRKLGEVLIRFLTREPRTFIL